jgi:hypothetical protein
MPRNGFRARSESLPLADNAAFTEAARHQNAGDRGVSSAPSFDVFRADPLHRHLDVVERRRG